MPRFSLDSQLAASTVRLARWKLSDALLSTDATYPWLILVPRRAGVVELTDLPWADAMALTAEIRHASRALTELFAPNKINVAAIGNQVRQLHVHVVARFRDDPAWPRPIWGATPSRAYDPAELARRRKVLVRALTQD
ncbi:MAG: HIT family protein [Alphaproteobacteria bacterium]|nr:HIT family protein [Alphaproteobacteria bacterium]